MFILVKGLQRGDSMYVPAENPYNPFNENIYNASRRFVEMGNRINDVTSDTRVFYLVLVENWI